MTCRYYTPVTSLIQSPMRPRGPFLLCKNGIQDFRAGGCAFFDLLERKVLGVAPGYLFPGFLRLYRVNWSAADSLHFGSFLCRARYASTGVRP